MVEEVFTNTIDYRGARGSNAGDQFHELWTLLQILKLLNVGTDLGAVSVEGVRTEPPSGDAGPTWDGVDVALYYGAPSLEKADRVEFAQLKYSSANPHTTWSVARLTYSTAKAANNSAVRKLADAFIAGKTRMKAAAHIKIRFVSNQGVADDLRAALQARWSGDYTKAGLPDPVVASLSSLSSATGLAAFEFAEFIACLDFSECGGDSRFAIQEKIIGVVAAHMGDDVSSEALNLQARVRALMLPERADEVVTEKNVLLWFGVSARDGLFPCAPDIRIPPNAIKRPVADTVLDVLSGDQRFVLVHGVGGCGKTTLMRQIADGLPVRSVSVNFDCFGGGRYIYSDDKRHLPEKAFLQLTNEVALALQLPLFMPRDLKHPADIKLFMAKLKTAGQALRQLEPKALLVIMVDAADNSITAAAAANPPERSFVLDLASANLADLPQNIRFVISSRTARKDSLQLPSGFAEIECPLFDLRETQRHLTTAMPHPTNSYAEQFHELSHHNPRVQAYAISVSGGDQTKLLDVLRPGGKTLPDVLKLAFDFAFKKLGQPLIFDQLLAALAFLPAPANLSAVARVSGTADAIVHDWASDLDPGLRVHDGGVSIADEDFEAYIKETASKDKNTTIARIADDFQANFTTDAYSSLHVADALVAAGRANQLLAVIERDPQIGAIGDPVLRRQVQVRRLWLALAACRHTGSVIDALKTILISAEAERDDSTLTELLDQEMDLSVEFSGASLRRTILLDRERIHDQGVFLAHDAARASRVNDRITTREQLHFYDAWLRQRQDVPQQDRRRWNVADRDIAARFEAILYLAGPKAALGDLMKWSPRIVPIRVAYVLVPQLIAAGKSASLRELVDEQRVSQPWDLLIWTALAMAGESVNAAAVERSLKRIRRQFIPGPETFANSYGEDDWQKKLLDTFIVACELAYRLSVEHTILLTALEQILKVVEGKARKLYSFDFHRLDALFRCWLLRAKLLGLPSDAENFGHYLRSLAPPPPPPENESRGRKPKTKPRQNDHDDQRAERKMVALFSVYAGRVAVLSASQSGQPIAQSLLQPLGAITSSVWEFDQDHDSIYLRAIAARAVMDLLIVPDLKAADLEPRANALLHGRYGDWLVLRRLNLWEQMRMRTAEAKTLVQLVADAAKEVREARAAASERLETTIRLARLVLPVSRADSEALFNGAVNIAREIDQEAVDQIEFVAAAAKFATTDNREEERRVAGDVFTFVSGASERLSSRDFNWSAGVSALAAIDLPCALAAVARWADDGTVKLETTLEALVPVALNRNLINPAQAAALSLLIEDSDLALYRDVASRATSSSVASGPAVIEEIAKDTLLFTSQPGRVRIGKAILEQIPVVAQRQGPWIARLRETVAFHEAQDMHKEPTKPRSDRLPQPEQIQSEPLKEFAFEPTGPFSVATEIEKVLKAANESGLFHFDSAILEKMMKASADIKDQIPFLNAVASLSDDVVLSNDRAEAISAALKLWNGTPAIDYWCRNRLPQMISEQFHGFARWIKQGQTNLPWLLQLTGRDARGELDVILNGVAACGQALGSRALFGIADLICARVEPADLGRLLNWYSHRLLIRVPAADRQTLPLQDVPLQSEEAIGRLIFALMSDIDTRIRWRAAHCFRRLARLQCQGIVSATVAQLDRLNDPAFREPAAPFYFLAARMWLALAMYRVSAESPAVLAPFKDKILNLAVSQALPHVGIREYAKRTLRELATAGAITLTKIEKIALDGVNVPAKGNTASTRNAGGSFNQIRDEKRRFKFDVLDSLRYWYEDILRIFPTVPPDAVLDIAERWIMDKWGAYAEANWWNKEPRKGRYDERRFGLWSHSHGSLPTMERYGAHLEWHAMHCTIGELLTTRPITKSNTYYDRFDYWLSRSLPTSPPEWISDHRGPTPLEARFWMEDPRTDNGWLLNAGRDEVLREIGALDCARPGWIVVEGNYTMQFPKREAHVRISTALVSPATALPLVRALQTARNPYDFRIPDEDDDLQVNAPPYQLVGWITNIEGDTRFDERDPCRYEIGRVRVRPGKELTKMFGLTRQTSDEYIWICKHTGEAALIYEAWCDEPPLEDDHYRQRIRSNGWRLWARVDLVQSYLLQRKMDLICEVHIDRRLRSEISRPYESDSKRKTHDKIVLFRADGALEDASRRIGAWAIDR
ncbi:MAG: hypothetical protein EPO27_03905 [Betaproteobacteria bacterium]|nr:MAG: hypothetical protein EPO27_03905 [Betaproteobacteria bacterium]